MSETYFVFTDEAGAYNKRPNEKFRHSHPFYIRSNVRFSADDYRLFQNEIEEINKKYGIPVEEEIKWSDLWEIHKGKYRSEFLKSKSEDTLKATIAVFSIVQQVKNLLSLSLRLRAYTLSPVINPKRKY